MLRFIRGVIMELPDRKGELVENPDRLAQAKFVQLVLAQFPQLHEEFAEAEGLLHLEMGTFSRFAKMQSTGTTLIL